MHQKLYSMDNSKPDPSMMDFKGEIKCLPQMVEKGHKLQDIEPVHDREAFRDIAYLLTTSGTSGLQVSWRFSVMLGLSSLTIVPEISSNHACQYDGEHGSSSRF